jgi:hypothetical protein
VEVLNSNIIYNIIDAVTRKIIYLYIIIIIITYYIIYFNVEKFQEAMPVLEKKVLTGSGIIKEIFKLHGKSNNSTYYYYFIINITITDANIVAGCSVNSGYFISDGLYVIKRGTLIIFEGFFLDFLLAPFEPLILIMNRYNIKEGLLV